MWYFVGLFVHLVSGGRGVKPLIRFCGPTLGFATVLSVVSSETAVPKSSYGSEPSRTPHRASAANPNCIENGDFNSDGCTNTLDLSIFKRLYRKPPGPSCCGV
jgi:hypothetical protein